MASATWQYEEKQDSSDDFNNILNQAAAHIKSNREAGLLPPAPTKIPPLCEIEEGKTLPLLKYA